MSRLETKIMKTDKRVVQSFAQNIHQLVSRGLLKNGQFLTISVIAGKNPIVGVVTHRGKSRGPRPAKIDSEITKDDFKTILAIPWPKTQLRVMKEFAKSGNKPLKVFGKYLDLSHQTFNDTFRRYGLPFRLRKSGIGWWRNATFRIFK
jgi:hypothetical protein